MSEENAIPAAAEAACPTYVQNPRPVGMQISLTLRGAVLVVDSMRKIDEVRLASVEEVRLTFEPRSFAHGLLRARLKLADGKTVAFTSITYRSMIDVRRQDAQYGAFLRELLAATARANPQARFVAGRSLAIWYGMVAAAGVTLVALALFTWRAFQAGATSAGIFGLAIAAMGVWQLEPLVRLNKPRTFAPLDPPRDLVPSG